MNDLHHRTLQRELLDDLPADDPMAVGSRKDLARLNHIMGNIGTIRRAISALRYQSSRPLSICELGCGDGYLANRIFTQSELTMPRGSTLKLLDLRPSIPGGWLERLRQRFEYVDIITMDLHQWLQSGDQQFDIIYMNLFLHHFHEAPIRRTLAAVSRMTRAFFCCEPRRSRFSLLGAAGCGIIGCNAVTRHDALLSVRAGFSADELSSLWSLSCPEPGAWHLEESSAGPFTHFFKALHQ